MYRFRHVTPNDNRSEDTDLHRPHIRQQTLELAQDDAALGQVLFDASELASSAMCAYCGLFPVEFPYFPDSCICLPWHDEYSEAAGEPNTTRARKISKAEIAEITDLLCGGNADPAEPPRQNAWNNKCTDKLLVQIFALEIMLCLDSSIEHLLRHRSAESLRWLAAAYQNLIDLTLAVREKYPDLWNQPND